MPSSPATIIPSIMALIAYLLWFFFGKDEKVINQAEYFATDNLNSLEVGYIYKGGAEKKDVISVIKVTKLI